MAGVIRALTAAENAAAWLSACALAALMMLITVDVLLRYIFNAPLSWGIEISEMSLLWITMLGAPYVLRQGGHIRVDLLLNLLPRGTTRVCAMFSSIVGGLACAVLVIYSSDAVITSFVRGTFKPTTLEMPIWLSMIVIPICAALLTLRFALLFFDYRSGARRVEDDSMM